GITERYFTYARVIEREVELVALRVELTLFPSAGLFALCVPLRVELEAFVIDDRATHRTNQMRRVLPRATLALRRCERRDGNTKRLALVALRTCGTEVRWAKATPPALEARL